MLPYELVSRYVAIYESTYKYVDIMPIIYTMCAPDRKKKIPKERCRSQSKLATDIGSLFRKVLSHQDYQEHDVEEFP